MRFMMRCKNVKLRTLLLAVVSNCRIPYFVWWQSHARDPMPSFLQTHLQHCNLPLNLAKSCSIFDLFLDGSGFLVFGQNDRYYYKYIIIINIVVIGLRWLCHSQCCPPPTEINSVLES